MYHCEFSVNETQIAHNIRGALGGFINDIKFATDI